MGFIFKMTEQEQIYEEEEECEEEQERKQEKKEMKVLRKLLAILITKLIKLVDNLNKGGIKDDTVHKDTGRKRKKTKRTK